MRSNAFRQRRNNPATEVAAERLDAFWSPAANVRYLSGFTGNGMLLLPRTMPSPTPAIFRRSGRIAA